MLTPYPPSLNNFPSTNIPITNLQITNLPHNTHLPTSHFPRLLLHNFCNLRTLSRSLSRLSHPQFPLPTTPAPRPTQDRPGLPLLLFPISFHFSHALHSLVPFSGPTLFTPQLRGCRVLLMVSLI